MTDRDPLARVAVALDTSDWAEFESWCDRFGPRVGVLKVGLEAYVRWGSPAVTRARRVARRLFLDLKLHDIPNTVAGAVGAASDLGADLLTLHAAGGPAMIEAARRAAGDRTALLAVTLLTHLDAAALAALDLPGTSAARAVSWALLARAAGAAGAITSPAELVALRGALPSPFLLVAPGIRPAGGAPDDQRRVATAAEAIGRGADLIVVGRPLTRAADPDAALAALEREIAAVVPG